MIPDQPPAPVDEEVFRGSAVCRATDLTYRQLDYYARTDLVGPSVRAASGFGSQRLYSFLDVLTLAIVKRLLNLGITLATVRRCIAAIGDAVLANERNERVVIVADAEDVRVVPAVAGGVDFGLPSAAWFFVDVERIAAETLERLSEPDEAVVLAAFPGGA